MCVDGLMLKVLSSSGITFLGHHAPQILQCQTSLQRETQSPKISPNMNRFSTHFHRLIRKRVLSITNEVVSIYLVSRPISEDRRVVLTVSGVVFKCAHCFNYDSTFGRVRNIENRNLYGVVVSTIIFDYRQVRRWRFHSQQGR